MVAAREPSAISATASVEDIVCTRARDREELEGLFKYNQRLHKDLAAHAGCVRCGMICTAFFHIPHILLGDLVVADLNITYAWHIRDRGSKSA